MKINGTYSYRCATLVAGKRSKFHLHVQAATFTVTCVFRLAGTIPALRRLVCHHNAEGQVCYVRTLHMQSSSAQFQCTLSHLLGLLALVEGLGVSGERKVRPLRLKWPTDWSYIMRLPRLPRLSGTPLRLIVVIVDKHRRETFLRAVDPSSVKVGRHLRDWILECR